MILTSILERIKSIPFNKAVLYLVIGLISANIGQYVRGAFLKKSLQLADASLALCHSQLDMVVSANQSQVVALKSLKEANTRWALVAEEAANARESALQHLAASEVEAFRLRSLAAKGIQDGPTCDALLDTDLRAACPQLHQRLYQHSENSRQN